MGGTGWGGQGGGGRVGGAGDREKRVWEVYGIQEKRRREAGFPGKQEKKGKITQHCTTFCNRKHAKRQEPTTASTALILIHHFNIGLYALKSTHQPCLVLTFYFADSNGADIALHDQLSF